LGIDELKIIRGKIKERIHSWSAGLTSVSELGPDERKKRLGLAITDEEKKITAEKMAEEDALAAQKGIVYVYPAQLDWRSLSRNNWTTPVKDEGDRGSCVAFAAVGTIESNLKISRKDPLRDPDLSEADLFFRGCGNCSSIG
jgi:C1A family cysteine protease